jgi:hypothetical protein
MRIARFAAVAFLISFSPCRAETYTVENWPADAEKIPCSAWEHLPDGSWALKGYLKVGASDLDNVGFKGDSSARMLDRKCGKK